MITAKKIIIIAVNKIIIGTIEFNKYKINNNIKVSEAIYSLKFIKFFIENIQIFYTLRKKNYTFFII